MSSVKKVIHLIPGFFPISKGGAEYFALNLCKGLLRSGITPIIVTRGYGKLPNSDSINRIMVKRFKNVLPNFLKRYAVGLNLKSKFLRMIVAIFDVVGAVILLIKIIRKYDIKVLHSSFIVPTGLIGVILKKLLKIKLIITVHGPADFYTIPRILRKLLVSILNRADSVITVSRHLEMDIRKEIEIRNISTIMNGIERVDFSKYNDLKSIEEFNIDREINKPILISTGRLVKIKRTELLIKTLPIVRGRYPDLKTIILGEGIEREKLERLVNKFNLQETVIMPGWVSESTKRKFLAISDIFIHLSREEGLSLSLIESQLAGLPAIVPDRDFAGEIIIDNYNGVRIKEPINPKIIAEKIISLIKNEKKINKMKNRSKKVFEGFTLDKMVNNYIREYEKI
ncbi:MAG: glycosyltransferase [Candidatus Lokiarchaeota archaeon]|nr:glycosyltransferase [Candidatus Lokiarchaeota archaeon]